MKKTLALLTAIALILTAVALPALAEEETTAPDQVTSATVQTGKGGRDNRQQPGNGQMPGSSQMPQQPGNGQMPGNSQAPQQPGNGQMPGNNQMPQQPGNGQMPGNNQMPQQSEDGQMPGNSQAPQQSEDGQMPDNSQSQQQSGNGQQTVPGGNSRSGNNRGGKRGSRNAGNDNTDSTDSTNSRKAGKPGKQQLFDRLLENGVITQEQYDSIMNYLKENAPQQSAGSSAPAAEGEAPALPDGSAPAEGEVPALPDGSAPAEGNGSPDVPEGSPEAMEQQLLKELLDSGVITQEQYDQLLTKVAPADAPTDPAGSV